MEVMEIIKDAFVFPSKDMKTLLIYVILSVVAGLFSLGGTFAYILGFIVPEFFMWGGMAVIISMLIGWVLYGYLVSVIKSGIEQSDEVPQFEWWENFITGFNNFIVTIVYFVIPAFITVASGVYMGASSDIALNALSQALTNLAISLSITIFVAVVVFIIFSFLQTMAEARLANTGSLSEALNIFEAAKDIRRIGVGKVIVLIILIIIIIAVIEIVLSAIFSLLPILSILSIIVTPYLAFFAQRAVGLLYSDIA